MMPRAVGQAHPKQNKKTISPNVQLEANLSQQSPGLWLSWHVHSPRTFSSENKYKVRVDLDAVKNFR